jgi:hypothetical protein
MKKRSSNTAVLPSDIRAWLLGDRNSGFTQFKADDELQALWREFGDHDTMFWEIGMSRPVPIDEVEDAE